MKQLIILVCIICSTVLLGQNVNISNGVVFDGEPYLSVNPNNSQHIVIAWMGWTNLSDRFKIKTKTSFDGGQTWTATNELPHTVTGYSSADPSIDFNTNGDVFIAYIDFTGTNPPVTGGIYLCKSIDGGLTWNAPNEVINTTFDGSQWPIDRPWLVIDKSTGANAGNIYVTSFNLNRLSPPYNPYLSVSSDTGNTFTTRYIDTTGFLAGNINPLPICLPTVSSSGVLYASYPSYVLTQSLYTQSFVAISNNGGTSLSHKTIITNNPPANLQNYPLAKKGTLIISNPADSSHLAFLYLSAETGDLDVYLTESLDAGNNWSTPLRLNDDPLMNNRMQDLIWGDFDNDGDLVVSWRDRRNGSDSTFQAETEIWATFRDKDSVNFEPNFQITNQTITHDTDLEEAGNDFMCIKLQNDTINATWGDPRDGELNIWFQQMNTQGNVLSTNQISSEKIPQLILYPNPTSSLLYVKGISIQEISIYDINGKQVWKKSYNENNIKLKLSNLNNGTYIITVKTSNGIYSDRIVKH